MKNAALLFCLFLSLQLQGQLLFSTLKPSDGLSSRETRCVFRDSEDFVWIGTNNGLNRFDGNNFKIWNRLSTGYPESLGEIVVSVTENRDGNIVFGTTAGIGILDKNTNTIKEIPARSSGKYSVSQLAFDAEKRLWVTTTEGLLVENNGELVPVSQLYPFAKKLDAALFYQRAFVFDSIRKCFWMGTNAGSYCLDLKNKKLFSVSDNPDANLFFTSDAVNSIALDNRGNIWFSNASRHSLCFYDFGTRQCQEILNINNNPTWRLGGGCNALFFDKQNRLWISSWLYSAFIRYPNGNFEEIPYDRNLANSIGYGFFHEASQDKYGNIWLATINGLSKLSASEFVENIVQAPSYKFYLTTGFANINAMEIDEKGNWWLAKMEGLVKYDIRTKKFQRFIVTTERLRENEVFELKLIDGELWCATGNGIQIFNPKTNKFRRFNYPGIKQGGVTWLLRDRKGYMWWTVWREGVHRYHPQTQEHVLFNESAAAQWGELNITNSASVFESSDGNIWVNAGEKGIRIFDQAVQKFVRPASPLLQSDVVSSFVEDNQKNIWLCTWNHGFLKCNSRGEVIDSITRKNGLPLNHFNDIDIDALGRLWATSGENLICILPGSKEVTKVDIPANFSFNDHWNSLLKKGNLLYGTMLDNVVIINTEKYQRLPQSVSPLISGFNVFGKEIPLNRNKKINLIYSQNFFTIDFASPFHRESSSMQYAYKLEGFDKDWVYCGRKLTASYTNVPDGHYTFLVKTTDDKGQWTNKASSVRIIIKPPFWNTWWFLSLLAIAVALALFALYQFSLRRKRKKRIDETIDYFANSLYGENSITEICWDIARNCISQLKLEDCVVYLRDDKRGVLIQKAAYGPKNPKDHEIINPIEIKIGEGIVGTAALTAKPVLIKDTSNDKRYIPDDNFRFSELAVPIIHEGRAIGVIDSENSKKNFFTEDDVKALSTIAAISANKIAEAKAEEAAKESEIQLLEIKKLLAESQLMALRAQMNPHFVFNCLNSIQECIVTEKYGEASLYLNKFSKLFRSVLNNSGKVLITLAEEIEVLELYLALEHMRFEKSFTYDIHIEEDLEADEIMIPSMLLQPYVENALWHGLMHKQNDRQLTICFKKINEEVFQCIVDDNGIGRKKALKLKEQQSKTKRHVSKGMTISRDRVELLQKQGQHAKLDIIDKHDENGNATGTKVVIELSSFLQ